MAWIQKMVGIYSITNKVTGAVYIGQSSDIDRRWMEHKTPKAKGNDLLHGDMQKYGKENFELTVLEECKPEELNKRELFYIKRDQPFYNTVGKEVSEETKQNISEGTKRWWNGLSEGEQKKIIANNLTGPKKGHAVTEETRKKISKKVSEVQKQPVRCIETGEVFESVRAFEISVGACTGTCAAYWKGKIKSVKGFHVEKCRD